MHRLGAIVLLWLAGCVAPAVAQPTHATSPEEILAEAVELHPDVWQKHTDDSIRHILTGFTCSAQLGDAVIVQVITVSDGVICFGMNGPELRIITGAKQAEFGESLEDVGRKAMSVLNVTQSNTDDPIVNYDFNGCPAVRVVATYDGWKADIVMAQKGNYYWAFGASTYDRGLESRRRLAEVLAVIDDQFKSAISCKASG